MERRVLGTLLVLVLVLLLAALSPESPVAAQDNERGKPEHADPPSTLRVAIPYEIEHLDPARAVTGEEGRLLTELFEGLFIETPDGVQPAAAERFVVSEDGREWTFTLRDGLQWSNGDPLTAGDFALAWRRLLNPDRPGEYAQMMDFIRGARAFRTGNGTWQSVGVSAPDDATLVVKLDQPTPELPHLLAGTFALPVPGRVVARFGDGWSRQRTIVGNGPWRLVSRTSQLVVLEASPRYRNADTVSIRRVELRVIGDGDQRVSEFRAGALDLADASIEVELTGREKRLRTTSYFGSYFYLVNTKANRALADHRVRRALALAIDSAELLPEASIQRPWRGFVPPYPGYEGGRLPVAPDAARKLLADAAYANGDGIPEIQILFNANETHSAVAQEVIAQWKAIGVRAKVEMVEWPVYLDRVDKGDYQIARAGWIGDFADPLAFLCEFRTGGHYARRTSWSSDDYDACLDASRRLTGAERMRKLAEAEQLMLDAAPVLPLLRYNRAVLVGPRIERLPFDILGTTRYSWITLRSPREDEGDDEDGE